MTDLQAVMFPDRLIIGSGEIETLVVPLTDVMADLKAITLFGLPEVSLQVVNRGEIAITIAIIHTQDNTPNGLRVMLRKMHEINHEFIMQPGIAGIVINLIK